MRLQIERSRFLFALFLNYFLHLFSNYFLTVFVFSTRHCKVMSIFCSVFQPKPDKKFPTLVYFKEVYTAQEELADLLMNMFALCIQIYVRNLYVS